MCRSIRSVQQAIAALPLGAVSIATGLAILTAAMLWPGTPTVTAMALVTLGATGATLARYRGTAALLPIVLTHFAIYGSLYVLFVGVTLHAMRPGSGLNALFFADLGISIYPLAIALEQVWCELHTGRSAE